MTKFPSNRAARFFGTIRRRHLDWGRSRAMAKFRVKYFGSNDVPVDLIKPILDEIDAELVIARPTNDAEVIEMGRDADGIIMHGSVPFTKEIISQLKKNKVVCRTGVGVVRMDLAAAEEFGIK